jgi:hypothetical protein
VRLTMHGEVQHASRMSHIGTARTGHTRTRSKLHPVNARQLSSRSIVLRSILCHELRRFRETYCRPAQWAA